MRRVPWPVISRIGSLLLLVAGVILVPASRVAQAQVEIPPIPDPVAVTLNPATTAFILSDLTQQNCPNLPSCVAAMAPLASFLARAREAGVLVLYTATPGLAASGWMPEIAPLPSET